MKKYYFIISLMFFFIQTFAQVPVTNVTKPQFYSEISRLNIKIRTLEKNNFDLHIITQNQKNQIDSLNSNVSHAKQNIQQIADSLHISLVNSATVNRNTQNQIQNINQTISNRTLYWIIAILAVAFVTILIFFILRNKLSSNTRNIDFQIAKTNHLMQNESIKLDSKLVEILQSQLSILKEDRKDTRLAETDHKLPLKVGEEIHRMRKRIQNMPQEIKGLSALTNSLQRLEEEFNDRGYTLEDLIGKKYVEGMKMEARFVDNPDIPKGEEIITDVLRPEIKYKEIVIQVAKVEVGKSY